MKTFLNRFTRTTAVLTLAVFPLLVASCAKEQSDEERRREKENRALQRMTQAGGGFEGFVTVADGSAVPLWLSVGAHSNPVGGTPTPTLEVSLHVGFFGGVTLAADETHFDNGQSKLEATFRRTNGSPLEFRATLDHDGKVNGFLDGPNAAPMPVTMSRVENIAPDEGPQWNLQITSNLTGSDSGPTRGVLSLKRGTTSITAPAQSDLPLLPPLEGSIRFEGSLNVPLQLQAVDYEPLDGSMELSIRDGARMRIHSIGIPVSSATASNLMAPTFSFNGSILHGSTVVSTLSVSTRPGLSLTDVDYVDAPARSWYGSYKSFSGLVYETFATIAQQTQDGSNPTDSVFPTFKEISATITFCQDGEKVISDDLIASSFDQLSRTVRFETPQSTQSEPWQLTFGSDWRTISGTGSLSQNSASKRGHIELKAWNQPGSPDCTSVPLAE